MKSDREIAEECSAQYDEDILFGGIVDACEEAIKIARECGSIVTPVAPLTFREKAAIAAMQGILTTKANMTPEEIAQFAAKYALALDAELKKRGLL